MWTGDFKEYVASNQLPKELEYRILAVYSHKDVVEQTKRQPNELTIDHKFPRIRWDFEYGKKDNKTLSEANIKLRFQLLKKSNGSASHNLLKSRACEKCHQKGKRGTPFGIKFYYEGDEN